MPDGLFDVAPEPGDGEEQFINDIPVCARDVRGAETAARAWEIADGSFPVRMIQARYLCGVKAIDAIKARESDLREIVLAGDTAKNPGPVMRAKLCREMFGKEAGVSARIKLNKEPAFNYDAEVAAAIASAAATKSFRSVRSVSPPGHRPGLGPPPKPR